MFAKACSIAPSKAPLAPSLEMSLPRAGDEPWEKSQILRAL